MKRLVPIKVDLIKLIKPIFILVFLLVSILLLFFNHSTSYVTKKMFLASNPGLLILDLLIIGFICLVWKKLRPHASDLLSQKADFYIIAGSLLLLAVQIIISRNIFFVTGWDVGSYIIPASRLVAAGDSLESIREYFSRYPNNNALVWIFSKIFRFRDQVLMISGNNDLSIIVMLNCIISTLTGLLTYKVVKRLTGPTWAIFSWLIYVLLVGLSPWVVITYSDSLALFLPILIAYIYSSNFTGRSDTVKWFLLGMTGFLGYYIRPQTLIILIAIFINEIWKLIASSEKLRINSYKFIAVLAFSFLLSKGVNQMITTDTGLLGNREDAFGWTHFAMMGLNNTRDGVYSDDDVRFSASFPSKEERQSANLDEIRNRLTTFTTTGFLKFMARKALVNYGDGTFAWSVEGGFYMQTFEDRNATISPILKSFYYFDGQNYPITATIQHSVWIFVLVSLLGMGLRHDKGHESTLTVLMMTLIGLTMFEMIFEARARYLYIYAPIYIALSAVGFRNICASIRSADWKFNRNLLKFTDNQHLK